MDAKRRSSGLLPFHTGNSTTKGRLYSQGYFQTLGNSADLALHADYFSERGLGIGGIFRARPNTQSRLFIDAWGINDRQDQGGAHLVVDAESQFTNGFRGVATVNITTNFRFRQAFLDSFRSATVPQERSALFLTRNHESYSTNIVFQREEVLFPIRSLVVRKSPTIEFKVLPKQVGPLIFKFRAGAEGLSRIGRDLETPKMVQRLDFFPSVSFRTPSFAGFTLIPTVGIRETYYSARITDEPEPQIVPKNLHRQYFNFELDLRTPTFEKTFGSSWLKGIKHVIEPVATYRRIAGIDHLGETIRFDHLDVIADTNEVEYGIINRFFGKWTTSSGTVQNYEIISLRLSQKYYFDPDFGGAFRAGEPNIFYPLNTLTGFALTGIRRNLAPVSMALRISPQPSISHDIRADYDTKLKRFRDVSISTFWQQGRLFLAGTYFKANALEPGTLESHHIQGQAGYGSPLKGLSASFTLSYNIRESKLLNSHSRLNYAWDCCGVALEYQQFDLGLRRETRINFTFTLKGIGSFGSLKRPESLF
jgi:LPS-assembly protein